MQIFFLKTLSHGKGKLSQEEARHCIKVLRHQPGDVLHTIDGNGLYYPAYIESVEQGEVYLSLREPIKDWGETPYHISLGISPLTKKDRFEWLLEKAVELGVNTIYPILCHRTGPVKLPKSARMERILLAAVKQSKRSRIPSIASPSSFSEFMELPVDGSKFIAWCETHQAIQQFSQSIQSSQNFTFLIGPEGDFTEEEITHAQQKGYQPVSLGANRLRSETAALFTLSICKTLLGY